MTENKRWRFYRSNLSTKMWDKEKNRLLADVSDGTFTTDDPRVANMLKREGYPEIPLDADTPPDIIVNQPTVVIEGNVPVMSHSIGESLGEATMAGRMKSSGGPKPPEVIKRPER